MTLLSDLRVLDATDGRAQLAGFVLAQLGARVTLVEAPGAPRTSVEKAYNRGKRSISLDLKSSESDRQDLEALLRTHDVLLTSGSRSELEREGLDYATTSASNGALVHVAISAFGQTGPKADYVSTDLVALAAGGLLAITGDEDRPPVRPTVPQAFANAAADAAGAALLAIAERDRTGRGQLVDVSAQASMLQATQSMVLAAALDAPPARRFGRGYTVPPLDIQLVWECMDGMVTVTFMFGLSVGPFTEKLMSWIHEEGGCDDAMVAHDWIRFSAQVAAGEQTVEEYERIKDCVQRFLRTKTKKELLDASLERGLLIAPIATVEDVAALDQWDAREYWEEVASPGGHVERHCGPIARFSETPLQALHPAPAVDDDRDAVLRQGPPARGRRPLEQPADTGAPLAGVKVLDFTWAMAGPAATRVLADYGATVVRVESAKKIEAARQLQPFVKGEIDNEGSGVFLNMNVNKRGIAIDLGHPAARDVVFDLVRWADAVCETFTPGTMDGWGLGYDSLREVNPEIVMLSSTLMGLTGPLRDFAGYGNLSAAICGFYHVTGWKDRWPTGPYVAYTDYVAPRFTVPVLLAALRHQRTTGEGQHIDFSHAEAALHLLSPEFAEFFEHGTIIERDGNRDPQMSPHGVYPCKGEDRWVAIAVDSDQTWARFHGPAGLPESLRQLSLPERRERQAAIDEHIAEWTSSLEASEVERTLQGVGVPAHAVHESADSVGDEQLAHREHFQVVEHAIHGPVTVEGSRWTNSNMAPLQYRSAPTLGEHTFEVLVDDLGYTPERVAGLMAEGALE